MKLPRVRFTVRRMMVAVAVAGITAYGARWYFRSEPQPGSPRVVLRSNFFVTLHLAGRDIPHTSRVFWVILGSILAALLGMVVGLVTAIVWAMRGQEPTSKL